MSEDNIEQKQLGQLVTFEKGKPPAQLSYYGLDAELYLTPDYLRGRGFAESIKSSTNAVRINEGDTVVLWDGSNAGEIFKGRKGILASTMCRIKSNDIFNRDYFFYAIKNWEEFLKGQTSGSGIPHVDKEVLSKIKIIPFMKEEQAKIAEILSTVHRSIELSEAVIAKQQNIKIGLMQDLLSRGIGEDGNIRSKQTHPFKDSPLGRIPSHWEVKELGQLLTNINQGWSPDCDSEPASIDVWGVLKTTSVVWEGFSEKENKALPRFLKPRTSLEIVAGDILMTRAGPNSRVGVIAYVYSTRKNLMLSDKIYRLNPSKEVDGRYLSYALSGFKTQSHLSKLKTGMAESQTNISQEIAKNLLVIMPDKIEQKKIADILDCISKDIKSNLLSLEKLCFLKAALMQDLLTGRKRVTALLKELEVACV